MVSTPFLGCILLPHTRNNATNVTTIPATSRSECASASSGSYGSYGSYGGSFKYWTFVPSGFICDLSDEFSPTPSTDFTITGIQECGDFFDQQQQQIFTTPGRRRKRDAIPLSTIQPPLVDVFLNPLRQTEKKLVEEFMVNTTRNLFNPPLPPSSFPHLFRLLRHTSLPCLSSEHNPAHMLLQCIWAGEEFECGKIFTPVPTDSGMCCAFNPRTILR